MRFWIAILALAVNVPAQRPGLDVPFVPQAPGQCGPAALAMLAQYYGTNLAPTEIADAIYLPDIRGTLTADLAAYAKTTGLWVRQYAGTQADLRQKLAAGIPLLILGKFGDRYHYFLVLDFDDFAKTVTVHTDQRARHVLSQEQLWRIWDRAGQWTLLVCPPAQATWKLSAEEHNDLGVFLERTGHLAAAAGHYRRAAELAPANSYYHFNLGNALMKQSLPAEAAAVYRHALTIEPANADAMNNLADAYVALNANLDEAVQLCERALALQPGRRAYYLDTLGHVLLKQGRRDEARQTFERALASTTDRQETLRNRLRQALVQP
jgi:tetratricopeptide (TPR) repeat protein